MTAIDINSSTYIDFGVESNAKNAKCEIVRHVKISKFNFAKSYNPNCSEEVFVIKKVKNIVTSTYVNSIRNSEEIVGTFY